MVKMRRCKLCGEKREDWRDGHCQFCWNLKMLIESNMDLVRIVCREKKAREFEANKKEGEEDDRIPNPKG